MESEELKVPLESNTVDVDLELDDDDVVELDEIQQRNTGNKSTTTNKGKFQGCKRKRRLTSPVWAFFEVVKEKSVDGKLRCRCKKCGAIFICDSRYGTENLSRHRKRCQFMQTRDIGQMILEQERGVMTTRAPKFDNDIFRELLVAAIVMHNLPFSFAEYSGIRAVLSYLREDVVFISRNTAKSDVLKMHNREKSRIKRMLEVSPGRICLRSDLWSSIVTDGYICVTAHFIDKDLILQKSVLNFCFMPPPHNGVSLSDKVFSLLNEWGIEKKLFAVTLDNASANDSFINMRRAQLNSRKSIMRNGEFFYIRCCAHVLNLQDGLKEIEVGVQKIRESVKYIKGSQARKVTFVEMVKLLSLDVKKGLRQDVPTRWNSTFLMLESALFYLEVFSHLELSDSNYKHCPSASEWEKVEKITKFLSIFYNITCVFSGTKYPTSNLYFPLVWMAYLTLKKQVESEDEYMRKMAEMMIAKFEKYRSDFSLILSIAVILDPRYKIDFVDFSYKKLYGHNSLEFVEVREKLFALFDEYEVKLSPSTNNKSTGPSFDNQSLGMETRDVLKEFDSFESDEFNCGTQKSQLGQYLDEKRSEREGPMDILAFWRGYQFRYPQLANMGRDVLSIPISIVASESTFSIGGRVIDQYRSSLKSDVAEALVCTRDWLYGAIDAAQVELNELAEDILNLNINKDESSSGQCSNSVATSACAQ